MVGEQRVALADGVARDAPCLSREEREARPLDLVQRGGLAAEAPAVEARVPRDQRALVRGQRGAQPRRRRTAPVEGRLEQSAVVLERGNALDHVADRRIAHLVGRQQRAPDLVFERDLATVVKQPLLPADVQHGRRVAPHAAPRDAHRRRELVRGESLLRNVAHRAGHRAVGREAPVEEELAAERDLRRRDRIVGRDRHRRQAERRGRVLRRREGSGGGRRRRRRPAGGQRNEHRQQGEAAHQRRASSSITRVRMSLSIASGWRKAVE